MSAIFRRPVAASRVLARVVVLLGVAAALVARPALAQSHDDADTRAFNSYTLTMPKVEAWARASLDIYKAAKAKAAAQGEDAASEDEDDEEDSSNQSLDEMAARINRQPEARRALRAAGLTAREYMLVSLTLMQAMMADQMMRQYPNMERPKINPANLAFVQKNRARLEARMNELKAAGYGQDQ